MHKVFRESGDFVPRHELDRLSLTSAITVRPATGRQLANLVAIAQREIPGVSVSEAGLAQFLRGDPESIFAFERAGNLLGGIAFCGIGEPEAVAGDVAEHEIEHVLRDRLEIELISGELYTS